MYSAIFTIVQRSTQLVGELDEGECSDVARVVLARTVADVSQRQSLDRTPTFVEQHNRPLLQGSLGGRHCVQAGGSADFGWPHDGLCQHWAGGECLFGRDWSRIQVCIRGSFSGHYSTVLLICGVARWRYIAVQRSFRWSSFGRWSLAPLAVPRLHRKKTLMNLPQHHCTVTVEHAYLSNHSRSSSVAVEGATGVGSSPYERFK